MQLTATRHGDALLITVDEHRLDAAVAIAFKETVRSAASEPGAPVILDLSQVQFLDSSGLGAVVAVMKLLGPDRPLELAGLTPAVAKVFRLTRMDGVFKLHPAVPDAGTIRASG